MRAGDLPDLLSGTDAMIVDDGELPGGEPSTVVGFRVGALEIVRAGRFGIDDPVSFSASSVEISVEDRR